MPGRQTPGEQPTTKVRVTIDGDVLTIRGQAPDRYVEELAAEVNRRIAHVRSTHPNIPRHHVAVLVALHLADELHRATKENQELLGLLEQAR